MDIISKKALDFTVLPSSSGHIFNLRTLAAIDSTSWRVSSGATAAKTRIPLPIEDTFSALTVTEADMTLCRTAASGQMGIVKRMHFKKPFILPDRSVRYVEACKGFLDQVEN